MYFKPNAKAQAENKFIELFGSGHDYRIVGERLSPLACSTQGMPNGTYFVELFIEDQQVAAAHHRDWRTAYRLLQTEIEKIYSEGHAPVQSRRTTG